MKAFKLIGVVILFITSVGALIGGWGLISDPSGSGLHLSLDYLDHTSFQNYLIPGMVLFIAIGLAGIITLMTTIIKMKNYEIVMAIYGLVLVSWIAIQVYLLEFTYYLHFVFGFIGIYLFILGISMKIRSAPTREGLSEELEFYQTLK